MNGSGTNLLSYEQALQIVRTVADYQRLGDERVPLADSYLKVLSEDILSPHANPRCANSAMDGFLVASSELRGVSLGQPKTFRVLGTLAAGDNPDDARFSQHAHVSGVWEIMTGAPVPPSLQGRFDAVVKVEDVTRAADGSATFTGAAFAGANIRREGDDCQVGERLLARGQQVSAEAIMALAGVGIVDVSVLRAPRIALLITGDEVVAASSVRHSGQVFNSSGPYLETALRREQCEVVFNESCADDRNALKEKLGRIAELAPDVTITTGAVSMGKFDAMGSVLQDMGAEQHFHKVAIRPGKPILFATDGRKRPIFALPGNPISTAVGLHFFVRPYLAALRKQPWTLEKAVLMGEYTAKIPKDFSVHLKARVENCDGRTVAKILPGQESFMIKPFAAANAWVVVRPGGTLRNGDAVDILRFA